MKNYARKATKLRGYERKAVNNFIRRVLENRDFNKNMYINSILLYGSAVHKKTHNDVDLAVLVGADKIDADPYTCKKNEISYWEHSGFSYNVGPLQEYKENSEVLENRIKLNDTDIHYIVVPQNKVSNEYYKNMKRKGFETMSGLFIKTLMENSIKLY